MTTTQIFNKRAALWQVIANSANPLTMKRAALLKLTELRRHEGKATKPRPKRPTIKAQATGDDARHFAFTKYRFLCAQRAELGRRWGRLSRGEFDLHQALTALPAEAPPTMRPHDMPQEIYDKLWADFVGAIKNTLTAVRDLPTTPR